jgi:hypothetical protein
MNKKYEVYNPLTGELIEALSFTLAKELSQELRSNYIKENVDPMFNISVLMENEDNTWTQSLSDENGDPVVNEETPTLGPLT